MLFTVLEIGKTTETRINLQGKGIGKCQTILPPPEGKKRESTGKKNTFSNITSMLSLHRLRDNLPIHAVLLHTHSLFTFFNVFPITQPFCLSHS